MNKLIAPVAAAAAALTLITPAAHAASFTPTPDGSCRVTLNDAERGPAWQADRAAKTLTIGQYSVSATEAFEATFPGLKKLGDDYVADAAVRQYLRDIRDGKDSSVKDLRNAARATAKPKLAAVGLKNEDADMYLDVKETAQVPRSPSASILALNADWYIGIDGSVPKVAKTGYGYEVGKTGRNVARHLYFVSDAQRAAFAANLDKTYYGQVFGTLENTFYYPLTRAQMCNAGVSHEIFPTQHMALPAAPELKNADLGDARTPDPAATTTTPAPTEAPKGFDAKLGAIIGIIATILAALGGLFALLQTMGVQGLPTLPQIPGLNK